MSGRQPGSAVAVLLIVPLCPWLSRRELVETMLLMRPPAGLTALWDPAITGPRGFMFRKWPDVPLYWKKWPSASCSSREVMTDGL